MPPTYASAVIRVGRVVVVAAALLSGTALAACTTTPTATPTPTRGGSQGTASTSPSAAPTPSATPTPSPTPTFTVTDPATPQPTWWSPLTGRPGDGPEPVLVVKLDNTTYAQPHAGLTKADVVYVEEVEYGITRIAAVFSSRVPTRIGPVRSARITDVDLLAQYDKPAFAYSGAQRKMYAALDAAPFRDVSPRRGAAGYSRDYNRRAPYNYFLDGRVALDRAPKASLATDIGFTFDEEVPTGGRVATKATMRWGYSSAEFDYSRKLGAYKVGLNGVRAGAEERESGQLADTVVLQYVRQTPSKYFDKGGGNTPHAETIGAGKAWVLRDGLAWKVDWNRPTAESGTTFTLPDGTPLPFKPGQTWVVLLDKDRKATVTPLTQPKPAPSPSLTSSPAPSSSPTSSS